MTRPRVVHVVPNLFGSGRGQVVGGAERYAFELARHMAAVTPTTLVTFGDRPGRVAAPGGLTVRTLGPAWYVRGQRFNPVHPGLVRAVAGSDVVHCHQTYVLASSLAAVLGRVAGRPVFTSDLGGGGWDLSAYVPTTRWFTGHLHISEYSRTLASHAGRPWAAVVMGGVDTAKFSPDPAVPREPLVVFAGRLLPHKGVDVLIDALPDGLTLEVIGRPYRPDYTAELRRRAAGKAVVFRHDCTDGDLIRAYRRARAVVLPSVYRDLYGAETRVPELLGQTPLEGMACGAPAVVTDVASLPEVVRDGATGFVVPPNDSAALRAKLEHLRDDPAGAARMGAAGRDWVLDTFTWPRVVGRCLTAYRRAGL